MHYLLYFWEALWNPFQSPKSKVAEIESEISALQATNTTGFSPSELKAHQTKIAKLTHKRDFWK